MLDAQEQQLVTLDMTLTARSDELDQRERLIVQREVAAERREQTANEREAIADSREQHATARERLLDRRAAADTPRQADPMVQIEEAFAREVSHLERSDAFLRRSREAVQRAQARLDVLRRAATPDEPRAPKPPQPS